MSTTTTLNTDGMTAEELARQVKKDHPNHRIAINAKGYKVAYWCENRKRWVGCASKAIDGKWYNVPYEILVNGELIPDDFVEVE